MKVRVSLFPQENFIFSLFDSSINIFSFVEEIEIPLQFKIERKELEINTFLIGIKDNVKASIEYNDVETNISVKEVRISVSNYCRVDKDVVWVTPEIWEQIQVMSNTNWIIK